MVTVSTTLGQTLVGSSTFSSLNATSVTDTSTEYSYGSYYDEDLSMHAPCEYGRHGNSFLPVLYSLFFVVGFLGNVLVLCVILVAAKLKSMTDVCLVNLALADLVLVLSLPFLAYYAGHSWIFGNGMCKLVLGMYYIGFYSSIFFIVLMSIDRYLAVVHAVFALRVRTKTYGILASVLVWFIAVCASFPELKDLQVENGPNETLCSAYPTGKSTELTESTDNRHFWKTVGLFKMNILGLLIPLSIVGFCYSMVLRRLQTARAYKKQAMRLIVLVMVAFFCCWTPYNIAAFLKALELKDVIKPSCGFSNRILVTLQATEAVAYSHTCLNPFLYVFVGQKFKRHLIRLLRRTPCFKLQFMKRTLTQASGSVYSQTTSVDERSAAM